MAGVGPVASGSQIASYVRTDGINAVVLKAIDNKIYELELTSNGWGVSNLTGILGLPTAVGSPAAYVRSDNTSAVVFVGSDQHVYEMSLPSGGNWIATDLSSSAGFPSAPIDQATGYVRSDGLDVVVYTATNGDIIELSRSGTQWFAADLTWATGAPAAAGEARPYTRADGYSIVLYRTAANHIEEMSLYSGGPAWNAGDLTAAGGCPNTASEPAPYVRIDGTNAVLFFDNNRHVYEERLQPGIGAWACKDLTGATGAPTTSTVPTGFVGGDRGNYVVFKDGSGHLWQLVSNVQAPNNWSKLDMTSKAGGP